MALLILAVWTILVFGGTIYCLLHHIETTFPLFAALALIGCIFMITDNIELPSIGFSAKHLPEASLEYGKQKVEEKRKKILQSTPLSSLLAYMCIPLVVCLIANILIF